MCICFYTLAHPAYSLVLAANRDEFLARPSLPAEWHGPNKTILSGIDVQGGGTWAGIERATGKFGIITNVREKVKVQGSSRGRLVLDWLESPSVRGVEAYLDSLRTTMAEYAGFNLLVGQITGIEEPVKLGFLSNRGEEVQTELSSIEAQNVMQSEICIENLQDADGTGVISNGALASVTDATLAKPLEAAWPKMDTGRKAFGQALQRAEQPKSYSSESISIKDAFVDNLLRSVLR
ncbi:MAG: hypothetical protein CYPHOPRED_004423 [Cyphobasidiales sp. Tagirdzhanova-0007]|nr:MAG: hypothetical protein CYPHOPRED_004423 [Cyphobasidiales sp. Tagirdzhanova-0007]